MPTRAGVWETRSSRRNAAVVDAALWSQSPHALSRHVLQAVDKLGMDGQLSICVPGWCAFCCSANVLGCMLPSFVA